MPKPARPNLLTLPLELRSQILEELLRSGGPLCKVSRIATIQREHPQDQGDTRYWRFELGGMMGLHPQILSCCHQLYREGYSILYSNTVVVSLAMYSGFAPMDVLGYWRLEDVTGTVDADREPLGYETNINRGQTTPILRRFQRVEFRLYIDFVYAQMSNDDNAISELCRLLCMTRCDRFNHIKVMVIDGSWQARFTQVEGQWAQTLTGLSDLSYDTCTLIGDVPKGIITLKDIRKVYTEFERVTRSRARALASTGPH